MHHFEGQQCNFMCNSRFNGHPWQSPKYRSDVLREINADALTAASSPGRAETASDYREVSEENRTPACPCNFQLKNKRNVSPAL